MFKSRPKHELLTMFIRNSLLRYQTRRRMRSKPCSKVYIGLLSCLAFRVLILPSSAIDYIAKTPEGLSTSSLSWTVPLKLHFSSLEVAHMMACSLLPGPNSIPFVLGLNRRLTSPRGCHCFYQFDRYDVTSRSPWVFLS